MDGRQERGLDEPGVRERREVEVAVEHVEAVRLLEGVPDVQRRPHARVDARVLLVGPRADADELGRGLGVERREERHVEAEPHEAVGEQADDALPRAVMPRRDAPRDRGEQADAHQLRV